MPELTKPNWIRLNAESEAYILALQEAADVLRFALKDSRCDGDLCNYEWHERARRAITKLDGEG